MAKMTKILVATAQISTGVVPKGEDEPITIERGEELTSALQKALGLKAADLEGWQASGLIAPQSARIAELGEGGESAALKAASERAEKAEGDLAAALERAVKAEGELTAALERAVKAEADLADLQKQVDDAAAAAAKAKSGASS